jgi:hypothetical protein
MNNAKREILAKVAAGTLTAQEAALELEELDDPAASPEPFVTPSGGGAARVRVVASMGSVTVIGDESVREAVAEGPHVAKRDGDVLVIESREEDEIGSHFTFGGHRGRFGINVREWKLTVRMNPLLALDAEVQAGALIVRGIRAPIRAEVQAGSAKLEDFTFPIDLDVQAGSVKGHGRLIEGRSTIRCQAGSVKLELDPASSVRIKAKTGLGRISLPGGPTVVGLGSSGSQAQVGAGAATLDIDAELGSVQVTVGQ